MSFLENITLPQDLKKLPVEALPLVCEELRDFIIDQVSRYGGHFSASLGTIEMTVALHYVFDTPHDLIVWDVGHQAYGHKILTGRKNRFSTNRQYGGICGFPLRDESPYDTFGVGHSSTSISAALGMNIASDYLGVKRKCIAVIGDGAMTAGLAFEAMNHAAVSGTDLLVILNDNNMSIDPNVGGLNKYLTSMTVSPTYNKFRDQVWDMLGKIPKVPTQARDFASRMEASVKGAMLVGSNLFESLGMRYLGMTDGHDVLTLVNLFRGIKKLQSKGPQLLHLKTIKGKGFEQAEKNQTFWHAPGVFDKKTGNTLANKSSVKKAPVKYQDIFGRAVIQLAKKNKKIMAITPAMPTGSSLKWMISEMPDRAFDVDICEQHAVTLSAGMATQGLRVFCTIYSSFMQRGYDQLIHDVAIQNLPVIFCIDRAGLVGEDGPTHHGVYDMAYMRCIPNMIVSAPMNENEMRDLMFTAQLAKTKQPFSIRYPRGKGVLEKVKTTFAEIPIGKGRQIIKGKHIAVLTIGHIGNIAQQAIEDLSSAGITPSLYDMRFVKPIDVDIIRKVVRNYRHIICIEDGCLQGGFGTAVLEVMYNINTKKVLPSVTRIGVPDSVIPHGSVQELHKLCEMDLESIKKTIKKFWKHLSVK